MENLYSIRIVRKEAQVVQGTYIKEFWKFCGVYVSEFVTDYDEILQDRDMVDCNIVLDEDELCLDELKAKHSIVISNLRGYSDLSRGDRRRNFGRKIKKDLLAVIPGLFDWDETWEQDFEKIFNAFIDSDYAYNSYLTHLFLDQFSDDMKLVQMDILNSCIDNIYKNGDKLEGSPYRQFAFLNCARKINRLCSSSRERKIYNDEIIMELAHQLSIEDELFSMGNVLAGLVGLSRRKLWIQGKEYMRDALEKEGKNKYSAFVYYALAHFIEVEEKNEQEAWKLYHEMGKVAPQSYRMLFKHATELFYQKRNPEWYNEFFYIYKMMKAKEKRGWIQPLELEYYYKCAKILNRISADISEKMGIKHVEDEEITAIIYNKFRNSKFMNKFIFNDKLKAVYTKYFCNKMESHSFNDIIRQL